MNPPACVINSFASSNKENKNHIKIITRESLDFSGENST